MSETISNMPTGSSGFLSDIIPVTQGSIGPGTGTSRGISAGKLLGSSGIVVYAGDPQWVGGVKADGSTDDTAAWTSALSFAANRGAWVVAPPGLSQVSSLTIPTNVGIVGRSLESYTATGSTTLGSVISCNSTSNPGIVMSSFSQLYNIQIDGNPNQPCIQAFVGFVQIMDATIFGGSTAIDFQSAVGQSVVANCRLHECQIGILNPLNVLISDTLISNMGNHGISMAQGCNNNTITGCRVEFSTNDNLHMDGTGSSIAGNMITGNIFDAPGHNNISITLGKNTVITGNELGRASRTVSGGSIGTSVDANIMLASCTGISITGNVLWVGRNNDGTGYIGPYYAIWDGGSNGTSAAPINIFSGNVLQCHNNSGTAPVPPLPINSTATFNALTPANVVFWQ